MVRFAYGPGGGRIGFHEIPNKNGVPLQSYAQLGQPLSGGCVRQTTADAIWMWNWAGIGTTVVVLVATAPGPSTPDLFTGWAVAAVVTTGLSLLGALVVLGTGSSGRPVRA
jgi:hypothetical protein